MGERWTDSMTNDVWQNLTLSRGSFIGLFNLYLSRKLVAPWAMTMRWGWKVRVVANKPFRVQALRCGRIGLVQMFPGRTGRIFVVRRGLYESSQVQMFPDRRGPFLWSDAGGTKVPRPVDVWQPVCTHGACILLCVRLKRPTPLIAAVLGDMNSFR